MIRSTPPPPQFISLETLPDALRVEEHFSRGNWSVIAEEIERRTDASQRLEAWNEAILQWLFRLKEELGGTAAVFASRDCFGMSDVEPEDALAAYDFADRALQKIRLALGDTALDLAGARPLLLIFADADDYFTYLSRYYGEGSFALSAGVFIHAQHDLAHIALPFTTTLDTNTTIAHELTHFLVSHLPLPAWLNEGLAMGFDRSLTGLPPVLLDVELAERMRDFWSPDNIQGFWAGQTFHEPGDASDLSYALAAVLIQWLQQKGPLFREFVRQADWQDAGQHAALELLGENLGELLGGLLGPGEWRPQRAAIARRLRRPEETAAENQAAPPADGEPA